MSNKNTGGPAFPRPISQHNGNIPGAKADQQDGMTLRDYFAGQILAGNPGIVPSTAWERADKMIEAR